jgi:putative transposase
MPAPLSMDLRERIVRTVEGGSSMREAARRFAVSDAGSTVPIGITPPPLPPAPKGRSNGNGHAHPLS